MKASFNIIGNNNINGKNAVIYARYSSAGQREQSIEGQLRVCREYAQKQGFVVLNEYVDRAKTGTNANRPAFQNMINDSANGQFQYVITYMVDRFARSKEDSVVYKSILRRNGVKVLSAMEQINDTEEGYLVEGLLEMFAEQYSRKLSVRVKNGLIESRAKGNWTGGILLPGYNVEGQKVVINNDTAPIVRDIFKMYANGQSKVEIVKWLNTKDIKPRLGKMWTINSLQHLLNNKKYIGEYTFNGEMVEQYPALIDREIFNKAQEELQKHKRAPARAKAKVDYMLYGKAFCGHCGGSLVGMSGTGKGKGSYYYYACNNKLKHLCTKKYERKEDFEIWLTRCILAYVLTYESIGEIVDLVLKEYDRYINRDSCKDLEKQLARIDKELDAIVNIMIAKSKNADILAKMEEKANDLSVLKQDTETQLAKLRLAVALPHSKEDITNYMRIFMKGEPTDPAYRKRLFDRLVNTIFVYDDKILCYFNLLDDRHIAFDNLPDLENAEEIDESTDISSKNGVLILNRLLRQKSIAL